MGTVFSIRKTLTISDEDMVMTPKEKEIVERINHPHFTVKFLEEWIKRDDNVFVNASAALQAVEAKGFYAAVRQIAKNEEKKEHAEGVDH